MRSGRPSARRWQLLIEPYRSGLAPRRGSEAGAFEGRGTGTKGGSVFRRGDSEDRHHEQPIQPKEVRMKEGAASEVTVVGHGARLEGTVESAGSLRIDGQ